MGDDRRQTWLVTGGAGFIGTNFVRYALDRNPALHIVNLDALRYAGHPGNIGELDAVFGERHLFVHGDILDENLLADLFAGHPINAVIHFAAESHVDRSIFGPQAFLETNVNGTFRLLEAVRKRKTDGFLDESFRFLHVSTDEVYGSLGESGMFTETSPYRPSSPYAASKAASDHFVGAWFTTFGVPTIITNCSNNFGPYQFPEKLIPLMILNCLAEKELPVYGDGRHVRDWLFVADHCDALLRVLSAGAPGETYNIGGNAERRNIDIVHRICDIVDDRTGREPGTGRRLIRFVADRPGHDRRYAIDSTKITSELGWRPAHSVEQALAQTVDWYLANRNWVDAVRTGEYREWMGMNYANRTPGGVP